MQKFYPILEKYKIQSLPLDCPLDPRREILYWPDLVHSSDANRPDEKRENKGLFFIYDYLSYLNKVKKWVCPFCGAEFFSSERLIIHFDDKHVFPAKDNAVCLADYCPIFRCEVLIGNGRSTGSPSSQSSNVAWPSGSPSGSSSGSPSESPSESPNALSSETVSEANSGCDKAKLKDLFERCTRLIRQCTLGTLGLESSMKEFNKLETELSKSICSYLTCERYWENDLERARHLSTTFIIVSLLFLICLFSICYYLVWSFFEAETPCELQLAAKIRTAYGALSLANLVRLVHVVNLTKCKWLCKKESSKENKETKDSLADDSLELKSEFKDEILMNFQNSQTKLPFKMKQSIFSVRSSSSDSIKKMQQEHLRNLEIHEKRLRDQEKLKEVNGRKLSKQQIIEEEENQFDELDARYPVDPVVNDQHGVTISVANPYGAYGPTTNRAFNRQYNLTNHSTGNLRPADRALEAELDREVYQHFNKKRFTEDGEIVSTKSKSEDKDSYYDKESFYECASVRKASNSDSANLANQFSKFNERKDQRRPSEQSSLCSYLTCPKAIRISTGDTMRRSKELLNGREPSGESGKDLNCESRDSHFGDAKESSDLKELKGSAATDGKQAALPETGDRPSDGQQQQSSPRKRLWDLYGDITLLNQARLRLLEQRAASRQLNLQLDENNQSNPICKKKPEIELKEFKSSKSDLNGRAADHRFDQSLSSSRSTSHNLSASLAGTNLSNVTKLISQNLDQSVESKQRALHKQSVSSSRSSSQTTKHYSHLVGKDQEAAIRKPLINPILNPILIFHQQQTSRSQPPSLSQTPRPASTNSSPCNR